MHIQFNNPSNPNPSNDINILETIINKFNEVQDKHIKVNHIHYIFVYETAY